jgi:MtN3 and saliva related transmembrane protein
MTELLGFIATFLISAAYVPQIFHMIKTKEVKGLNTLTFLVLIVSGILWIIYGYLINSLPLIVCNIINTIQIAVILYYKTRYDRKN